MAWESYSKRLMDLTGSLTLLIAFFPVLCLLSLIIKYKMGSPIIFRQIRAGINGEPYTIYKFRSLKDLTDSQGNFLPDGERLTDFGSFLRRSSLDELPELVNVLKGEMSLVGPRPLYVKYLPYYTDKERLRHSVRPGITGWAQVHGRNLVPWNERLAMDVWYVENRSLLLDLKILWMTVLKVVSREGAAADPDQVETDLDEERQGILTAVCAGDGRVVGVAGRGGQQ